jgi:hypothetical protein
MSTSRLQGLWPGHQWAFPTIATKSLEANRLYLNMATMFDRDQFILALNLGISGTELPSLLSDYLFRVKERFYAGCGAGKGKYLEKVIH